ncbi:MAG: glycosyltransferase [Desulfovibrio sp.]|jgi:glycosyltransferase involved in cell wall biosynthesis|nr:glycosyltransferase [Desulfovibrio sp.]
MRILFLHSAFPGVFRSLAQAYGADQSNTVLFLAESGQKGSAVPGVRRMRLAPPLNHVCDDAVERDVVLRYRRAARAGNAMLGLRRDGFAPDLVCATPSTAGSLFVRDVFPKAFFMVQADWFHTRGESHSYALSGSPVAFATARLRNLWEYNALGDCDLAVTSSEWQRVQYPAVVRDSVHVHRGGINVAFFSPEPGAVFKACGLNLSGAGEVLSFSGAPGDPSRGFGDFLRCLPGILERRPGCHVLLAWPDRRGPAGQMPPWDGELPEEVREALPPGGRERIHPVGMCSIGDYRAMLRASTVHVYLTAPNTLSTGLLEAMACGALVVGSDTAPVQEVVRHAENGFLCVPGDGKLLVDIVSQVLERAPLMGGIRAKARESVVRDYNAAVQTKRLMQLLHRKMSGEGGE